MFDLESFFFGVLSTLLSLSALTLIAWLMVKFQYKDQIKDPNHIDHTEEDEKISQKKHEVLIEMKRKL